MVIVLIRKIIVILLGILICSCLSKSDNDEYFKFKASEWVRQYKRGIQNGEIIRRDNEGNPLGFKERKEIFTSLSKRDNIFPILLKYLQKGDKNEKRVAYHTLYELNNKEKQKIYYIYIKEKNSEYKRDLEGILSNAYSSEIKKLFLKKLKSIDYEKRLTALEGLNKKAYKNDKSIIDVLNHLLKTEKRDGIIDSVCTTAVTVMEHKDAKKYLHIVDKNMEKGMYGRSTATKLGILDRRYGFGLYDKAGK